MLRNQSLDALRGLAVLGMVLAASIAFGILPGWMYHAQTPPPSHQFDAARAGITWVDLVFPFFLFSLGAAIPLALNKIRLQGKGFMAVLQIAFRRLVILSFFAVFIAHIYARSTALPKPWYWILPWIGFALLFLQFFPPGQKAHQRIWLVMRWLGYFSGVLLLYWLPVSEGDGFSLYRSDIIILLLANMAFSGTLIWWFTKEQPLWRLAILPILLALLLSGSEPDNWSNWLVNQTPFPWLYQFSYFKYLFIVIPGTLAGDWLLQQQQVGITENSVRKHPSLVLLLLGILLINLVGLYHRQTGWNMLLSSALCVLAWQLQRTLADKWVQQFIQAGCGFLLLGLCLEAWQGGVKKDPATFSYFFITTGLSFCCMLIFYLLETTRVVGAIIRYIASIGRNPMIAYVAGSLLILPLLNLLGLIVVFDQMQSSVWLGFLRGLLFTAVVSIITYFFTRKGWYWKA